ncbi:39S ribosomal protein L35, mitochondrial [Catharus ustulatus]|uniref:39S ribosomal protein L35, mitochondrial n=1 Tax=Catharus ustulatus TaxID=91951 RepID=UPI00140AADFE|nr:39S ribosomal protein L35, mitochondrial [Catharus ustulatus]
MARSGSRRGPRKGALRGSCRRRLRPPFSGHCACAGAPAPPGGGRAPGAPQSPWAGPGAAPPGAAWPWRRRRRRAGPWRVGTGADRYRGGVAVSGRFRCRGWGCVAGTFVLRLSRVPPGILRRWAPRALPLCGPSARCVGHGPAPAPAPAPLWTPRLLGENRPRAGTPSVLSSVTPLLPSLLQQPARTLTYCSLRKGKRKSVKSVVKRFLRLHNGLWVRRKSGYKKKLWKKSAAKRKRLREFVLCTRTQCKLLDKMTTSFWKRRNWYADDPYQKYHDRTNLRV